MLTEVADLNGPMLRNPGLESDLRRPLSRQSSTSTSSARGHAPAPPPQRPRSAFAGPPSITDWHAINGQDAVHQGEDLHDFDGQHLRQVLQQALEPSIHPIQPPRAHHHAHHPAKSISTENTSVYDGGSNEGLDGKHAGIRKKKSSRPSQANGDELRRLLHENQGRSLQEVAHQVWADEESARAEKSKQIFGMIWLSTHVVRRPNMSITRSKVCASYMQTCTAHNIKHLNPASFGKLVHIIFEDLKTRRLGVRGESKYHYVNLALVEDDGMVEGFEANTMTMDHTLGGFDSAAGHHLKSKATPDTAYFSPTETNQQPMFPEQRRAKAARGVMWTPATSSVNFHSPTIVKTAKPLHFAPLDLNSQARDKILELPKIHPYLPPGSDPDAVNSLVLVYHSHCKLAIDNFQHCRTTLLRDGFKSLLGQLTRPGLDLLMHDSVADWVRECDWLKYQRMVPMLDRLLLMDVPGKGLAHIEQVAQSLCDWIVRFFSTQQPQVVQAMLDPARVFVGVIERFLRVQRATRDVVDALEMPESRTRLWGDWVTASKPLAIVSNTLLFSDRGHRMLLHLLTKEIRFLLSPEFDPVRTTGTLFDDNGVPSDFQLREENLNAGSEVAPVVRRLLRFLADLPLRFHQKDARTLLSMVEAVTGNVTRNMALGGVADLGKWWQVKLFVDEAMYWLAERGGMMGSAAQAFAGRAAIAPVPIAPAAADFDFSRPMTARTANADGEPADAALAHGHPSPDFPTHRPLAARRTTMPIRSPGHQAVVPRKRRHSASTIGEDDLGGGNANDDSGIAMGMDDDFGDQKYTSFVHGVHGSDPADVVVC